jgi:hypothetical protein
MLAPAHSQTLQELQELQRQQNLKQSIDDLERKTNSLANLKTQICFNAVGNEPLCRCLANSLPIAVDFLKYVSIVNLTREEMEYDKLSSEQRQLVDLTRAARDKCVKSKR